MSKITDELRKYATVSWNPWPEARDRLLQMCDRIDAEHDKSMSRAGQLLADAEKDRDYNYANWQDCKQRVLQGKITFNELNTKTECLVDALSRCVELPVDADGEVIHVGDVMERMERCGKVVALQLSDNPWGDGNHWAVQLEGENAPTVLDRFFRHHHKPTVEDVLVDMMEQAVGYSDAHTTVALNTIAEYAAKLQLRGDGEDFDAGRR